MKPTKLKRGMMWLDTNDGSLKTWTGKRWKECVPPSQLQGPMGPAGPCGMTGADGAPGRDGVCYLEEVRWSCYAGRAGAFGIGLHLTKRSFGVRILFWEFEVRRTKQWVPLWQDRLMGEIAKALSANSPFLNVIHGGVFPAGMGETQSCNTCSPKKS